MTKVIQNSVLQTTKHVVKMAESKAIIFILNLIGIPFYGYTLFINIDNIKGWVLTAVAAAYGVARVYFYIRKSKQALRREEYQLWEMEREKRKKDRQETVN